MKKIAIVDYSIGNLFSVYQACKAVETDPYFVKTEGQLKNADGLILPGVGAFPLGMKSLEDSGLAQEIVEFVKSGKPFFGICLGMQLLCKESSEFGHTPGLGLVSGKVLNFRDSVSSDAPVPQVMWNELSPSSQDWTQSPLKSVSKGTQFYFVHSYYCEINPEHVLSYTTYGGVKYCSSLLIDNVFATQFHPEKSGKAGIAIYENWKSTFL